MHHSVPNLSFPCTPAGTVTGSGDLPQLRAFFAKHLGPEVADGGYICVRFVEGSPAASIDAQMLYRAVDEVACADLWGPTSSGATTAHINEAALEKISEFEDGAALSLVQHVISVCLQAKAKLSWVGGQGGEVCSTCEIKSIACHPPPCFPLFQVFLRSNGFVIDGEGTTDEFRGILPSTLHMVRPLVVDVVSPGATNPREVACQPQTVCPCMPTGRSAT